MKNMVVELLGRRKLTAGLGLLACALSLFCFVYDTTWIYYKVLNENSELYSESRLFGHPGEEPRFKLTQSASLHNYKLGLDLSLRGAFAHEDEEDYDEDWETPSSKNYGYSRDRVDLRVLMSGQHGSLLETRRIPALQDPGTWSLSDPIDMNDFGRMSLPELRSFKEQLLSTVLLSIKVITFNDPFCIGGNNPLGRNYYSSDHLDSNMTKSQQTKTKGTRLLFQKYFYVHRSPFPCQDFRVQSTVGQVLRTKLLPDQQSVWSYWFRGMDETMLPGRRCYMKNKLIEGESSGYIPKTLVSVLFCY